MRKLILKFKKDGKEIELHIKGTVKIVIGKSIYFEKNLPDAILKLEKK